VFIEWWTVDRLVLSHKIKTDGLVAWQQQVRRAARFFLSNHIFYLLNIKLQEARYVENKR
jgi:hypothetical protein